MKNKLNVWLLKISEPLPLRPDVKLMRTGILAQKLADRGHTVTWWTSAFGHSKKEWVRDFDKNSELSVSENYKITGLRGCGYSKNFSVRRYIDHEMVAQRFAAEAQKRAPPDIVVASMPSHNLAFSAASYANRRGIPFIVDIRDPWPDAFLFHLPVPLQPVARVVLYRDFKILKNALRMAGAMTAVSGTLLAWGLSRVPRVRTPADMVFPLGYQKIKIRDYSKIECKFAGLKKILNEKFIVLYIGALSGKYHDPSILISAAKILRDTQGIHFIIGGDGELAPSLKKEAAALDNITFTGWLNHEEMEYFLSMAKVGMCPAVRTVNNTSNKIYAYLSAGLPIVSSFAGDAKKLVEERKAGFYCPPRDVESMLSGIRNLYRDKNMYNNMSEAALLSYKEMFDADKIYADYSDYIEAMAAKKEV